MTGIFSALAEQDYLCSGQPRRHEDVIDQKIEVSVAATVHPI
jgi:hypothetical protein